MSSHPETTSDPGDKGVLRRLLRYFKPHTPSLVAAMVGAMFVGAAYAAVAPIAGMLMDLFSGLSQAALSGQPLNLRLTREALGHTLYDFTISSPDQAKRLIWIITSAGFVLIFFKSLVHFGKEFLLWRVTNKVLMQLKYELFHHTVRLPQTTFDREKSGEMLSRVTYDVSQVEAAIASAVNLAKAVIYALIYVAMMFYFAWWLTLAAMLIFPLSAVIIKIFGDRIRRLSRAVSLNVADYTSFLGEAIAGAKVIKTFGREADQTEAFRRKVKENYSFSQKIARLNSMHNPIQEVFSMLGTMLVLLLCGYRMLAGHMTLGELTTFLVLLTNAYKPIKTLGEVNNIVQRALASSRRIFNLLDLPDEGKTVGSGTLKPAPTLGKIEFKGVHFRYNDDNSVLNGFDLRIEPGETVALVGPSGAGKSTIVSLIPRFYAVKQGEILIDGVDTAWWEVEYLRAQMALVPQETVLFSGTVEDNIRFGNPKASRVEVEDAARAANAHGFITELPGGYGAQVGERGVQLSGGQRQRIAIARAILRDPKILLLDEATSSLDTESERLIQEALERFQQNRTTVVIAHRLSTVKKATRIAVVVEGRIVEIGAHDELYERGGVYRRLCEQQLG